MSLIQNNTATSVWSNAPFILNDSVTTGITQSEKNASGRARRLYIDNKQNATTRALLIPEIHHIRTALYSLNTYRLLSPISITVEFDEIHYLAQCIDLPIYATGDTLEDAINSLKDSLEELAEELKEDDNLSEDWKGYKTFLEKRLCRQ